MNYTRGIMLPKRMTIWIGILATMFILYVMTILSTFHPTTNIWKQHIVNAINKPFQFKDFVNLGITKQYIKTYNFSYTKIPDEQEAKIVAKSYPNIPIVYWIKTRENHWKMHLTNGSCAPFPDIYRLNIKNDYWQVIHMTNSTTVQVYSAYYDNRQMSGEVVRIVSMVNKTKINFPGNTTYHCQLWFENEDEPVIAPMDKLDYMWFEFWHSHRDGLFGPFLLGCSIPVSHKGKIPKVVSFVENPCDGANNMLRVVYDDTKRLGEFAVCVKGLDFLQVDFSFRLIEWMEFMFEMGVNKIYFYHLEVHPKIQKVLDHYIKLGKIDVRHITLPAGHPTIPLLQHMFQLDNNFLQCLDEIIPYNDCFYRNIYSHDYVAILDVDEIMVPMKDKNWHDLIVRAKGYHKPDQLFNGFTLRPIYFLDDMDKEIPHEGIPEYMHMFQHVVRAQNFTPPGFFVKTMFNTNETRSCHNHYPITTSGNSIDYTIPNEDGRVHHYRKYCSWEVKCENYINFTTKDTGLWNYSRSIIPRVEKIVDLLGLLYENSESVS